MYVALGSRHTDSSTANIFRRLSKYSFSLKEAERADAIPNKTTGKIEVAIGFKLKISGTTEYYVDSELQEKEDNRDEAIFLPFDDKEVAERVANAFQHAIRLCGGGKVKEVF
jgi:hypothetical protein